jgi:hypothetical protein
MSVTIVKKFGIFFLGMKHALKQVQSKMLTSLAKIWKCKVLGYAKIVESVFPSLLLCLH